MHQEAVRKGFKVLASITRHFGSNSSANTRTAYVLFIAYNRIQSTAFSVESGKILHQWVGVLKEAFSSYNTFFYRQLHFRSQPGSCLAIVENGLKTELTLPTKVCLNDFS